MQAMTLPTPPTGKRTSDLDLQERIVGLLEILTQRVHILEAKTPLSRRDWFVGMAMQGLIAKFGNEESGETYAPYAIGCADAIIAELDRTVPPPQ